MDVTRWQLMRALFDELIELDPSAWAQALLSRCPDDAELREEVLEMLRADVEARGAPSRLADRSPELLGEMADADDAQQVQGWVGRQLGAWRIVRPLGRGGMGMVYLAEREDGEFRQQAAIKLLRANDDDGGMQRFLAERQILAGLDHPNIAHLLDGGRGSDGVPWFALEYVDGTSLTAWCDAHRLDIRHRLKLFLNVCAAVSYAHERLVIHRDLKPANILVDKAGQVKLLDFGIAKLIDVDTSSTATAARIFTPEYAAPEQVRGERMTTAVDVYSLGVVLYELLTGRRPYRLAEVTGRALERAIVDQMPSRPSQVVVQSATTRARGGPDARAGDAAANRSSSVHGLGSSLRGDLDAIVLKALRKEPDRRYTSVREFAQDLQAYFDRRPVAAHSGGWRYTFDRFLRRNALAVGFAGLAFLALSAGLMTALFQANEARIQRDTAQAEAAKARASLGFMTALFKNVDPGTGARTDISVRDLLDEGARDIQFAFADQPGSRLEMLLAMASAYTSISMLDAAQPLVDEAEAIATQGGDPVTWARVIVERCRLLTNAAGRLGACESLSVDAERRLDPGNPAHIEAIVRLIVSRLPDMINAVRYEDAERESRRAVALLPDGDQYLELRSDLIHMHSTVLMALERHAEAEVVARQLLAAQRASAVASPRDIADSLSHLARTIVDPDRVDEKLAMFAEALALREEVYGKDHPLLGSMMNNYAIALNRAGRTQEAIAMMRRVVKAQSGSASAISNLASMLLPAGEDAEALALLDTAIDMASRESNVRGTNLPVSLGWRASAFLAAGRLDEAERDLLRARTLLEGLAAEVPNHPVPLKIRALLVATRLARPGSASDRVDACAEAERVTSIYPDSSEKGSKNEAFAKFLVELCQPRPSRSTTDAVALRQRADTVFAEHRFGRRLAETVIKGVTARPGQIEVVPTPASRTP